jgi:hypothetical protein
MTNPIDQNILPKSHHPKKIQHAYQQKAMPSALLTTKHNSFSITCHRKAMPSALLTTACTMFAAVHVNIMYHQKVMPSVLLIT